MEDRSEPAHDVDNRPIPGWIWLVIAALGISFRLLLRWLGI